MVSEKWCREMVSGLFSCFSNKSIWHVCPGHFMTMQRTSTIATLVIVAMLSSCTDEQAKQLAANHIESRMIDGVVEMLLNTCAPDQWCKPYAEDAAQKCVKQFVDTDELVGCDIREVLADFDPVADNIHLCAIQEVNARYAEDNAHDR